MKYKPSSRERCFLFWLYFTSATLSVMSLHSYFCHYLKNFSFSFSFPREKLHIIVSWFLESFHIYILKFAKLSTRISQERTRYDRNWIWRRLIYGLQKGSRIKHHKSDPFRILPMFFFRTEPNQTQELTTPRKHTALNIYFACFFLVIIITSINIHWAILWI